MKIAFLLDDTLDSTDGVQQYVLTLGAYFAEHNHEVHYIVSETKRTDLENIHSIGRYLSMTFNQNNVRTPLPASKKAIKAMLEEINPDIIHVQMPCSPLFAGRVIKMSKPETLVVGTYHTYPATKAELFSHKILAVMIGSVVKRIKTMISVSQATKDALDPIYKTKSVVIPNPVNIDEFVKQKKTVYTKNKRVVFLGRFVKRKGVKELVLAIDYLVKNNMVDKSVEFVMAGKGPDRDRIKRLAFELSLGNRIAFPGFVEEHEKPDLLSSANVAIYPSTSGEAFGIVLIEAMAAGSGVVLGGDNPGYRSVLEPKAELLFDPKNTREMAEKIALYLDDEIKSLEIHSWQQKYVKMFDVSRVADQLIKLYV